MGITLGFYSTSSGRKTESAQISVNPGALVGVDLTNPAAGQANLTLWDSENSTTSGKTVLAELQLDAGLQTITHEFSIPVTVNRGIYAELTYAGGGSGSTFVVRFFLG